MTEKFFNRDCIYRSPSTYLHCAVNPNGCEGCKDYQKQEVALSPIDRERERLELEIDRISGELVDPTGRVRPVPAFLPRLDSGIFSPEEIESEIARLAAPISDSEIESMRRETESTLDRLMERHGRDDGTNCSGAVSRIENGSPPKYELVEIREDGSARTFVYRDPNESERLDPLRVRVARAIAAVIIDVGNAIARLFE